MGKSIPKVSIPYVPCPKMKPHELGSISKSLTEVMKKLETLRGGHEAKVHTKSASNLYVVSKRPKPVELCQEGVNKLREFVEAYSAEDTTFSIHKLKSSLEDSHRKGKEESKRKSMEKEEVLKSEVQRKLQEHLDSLEPKSMEVLSYGEEDENDAAVQSLFLSTYMSPLDLYISKRLQQPLSLKIDQFLTLLDGKRCWSSSKNEQGECSYFITCSRVPNLIFYISHCPSFKTSSLGGIICVLSTPHFHFYMLIRLQTSLVHSSAISYMLRMKNGDISCNSYMLPWGDVVNCFGNSRGLKYHSWVLSMLLSRMSISEIFTLLHSRWKLFFNSEMDQLKPCWPVLKLQYFKVHIVQILCENLLELVGISNASYLPDLGRVLGLLVMVIMRIKHKNSSSPLIALLCSTSCVNSNHGLSLGAYMMLVIQCDVNVVKLGVEPPWPFDEGYVSLIVRKTRMGTSESANVSGLNVVFLILVAELVGVAPMSPRQAIMVYDRGRTFPPTVTRELVNEGANIHQQILLCSKCGCENSENSGLQCQHWFDFLNRPKHSLLVHEPGISACACGQPSRRSNQGNEALKDGFRNGVTQFLTFTILIYDPGGDHDN